MTMEEEHVSKRYFDAMVINIWDMIDFIGKPWFLKNTLWVAIFT